MITEDELEDVLKPQFQKHLEFELNGKVYKRGKFLLYRLESYHNNYEVTFIFDKPNSDKVENFKVPYPFGYEYYADDGHIFFDYRLTTLVNNDRFLLEKLKDASEKYNKSKYFDTILKINCFIPE